VRPLFTSRRTWLLVLLLVSLLAIAYLFGRPIRDYDNSIALLLELEHARAASWAGWIGKHKITVKNTNISLGDAKIRARLYVPEDEDNPRAIVLVHGIHRLGIGDPRLVTLANAFAQRGILVLTPELKSLEDYRIDPAEIDAIGQSAKYLELHTGRRVGVLGVSFSGSLALLAAATPQYSQAISCVIAVGAYDDLEHVARFLFNGEAELPDGSFRHQHAEQYGALVLVYAHPEEYFSKQDVAPAKAALKLWLEERFAQARAAERAMTPEGQEKVEAMFRFHLSSLEPEFEAALRREAPEMERISPHGQLRDLRVPVYLLHGTDDEVIPSAETGWLARDIPASYLKRVLITPAFGHVDASTQIGLQNQWELVSFMASIFHELRREPAEGAHLRSR
jgi:pimeloyl-ACP methyl ester carboxylesterase